MQRQLDNGKGIFLLWLNWVLGLGILTLMIVMSLWIKPLYMPFVAYGLQFIIFLLIKWNREQQLPVCYVYPFVVSRTLFWSGNVMLVINLLYSRWFSHIVFDPDTINHEIPFLCSLIVSPIAFACCLWAHTHQRTLSFCRDCKMRSGTAAERGFLGMIFTREGQYQIFVAMWIAIGVCAVAWPYYLLTYVNDSLTVPDRLVFFWMQVVLWLVSIIYIGLRYIGIWAYYCQNIEGSAKRHGRSTQVRFIIICENLICLRQPQIGAEVAEPGAHYFDTPESNYIPWQEKVRSESAMTMFRNQTDITGADIRFFYSTISGNADCNIFHYLTFLSPAQKEKFSAANPDCVWVTFRDLAKMINEHDLAPLMSAEIMRLYNMAMAWKTYDRTGKRRYRIKHYKPTFHVEDIKTWDIDFNDLTWLYVADNNEDTPFYKLRRFWRKYINGVGNIIDEINPETNNENR